MKAECGGALAALDATQTQQRPKGRPAAWSIQQIIEHLLLTYASTQATMENRIAKGRATRAAATASNRCAQFVVARLGYFPKGLKAPAPVQPPDTPEPSSGPLLAERLARAVDAMDGVIVDVARVLGPGRTVSHTVLGPMRLSDWRRFHLAHARHHVKQILAILDR